MIKELEGMFYEKRLRALQQKRLRYETSLLCNFLESAEEEI